MTVQRQGTEPVLVSNLELRQSYNEYLTLHTEIWIQVDGYWRKAIDNYGDDPVTHRVSFGEDSDEDSLEI